MPVLKPSFPVFSRSHTLAQGLQGAWLFYEKAGDAIHDLSRHRLDGTFSDSSPDDNWTNGQYGPCLNFDADHELTVGSEDAHLNPESDPWSITVGLSMLAGAELDTHVVSKQETGVNGWNFQIDSGTQAGGLEMNIADGKVTGQTDLRDGEDHLTTFVIPSATRSTWKLYVDGVDSPLTLGGSDPTLPITTGNAFVIGNRDPDLGKEFDGKIFFVYFHNRALSAEEAVVLHSDPFMMFRLGVFKSFAAAPIVTARSAGRWLHTLYEDLVPIS